MIGADELEVWAACPLLGIHSISQSLLQGGRPQDQEKVGPSLLVSGLSNVAKVRHDGGLMFILHTWPSLPKEWQGHTEGFWVGKVGKDRNWL